MDIDKNASDLMELGWKAREELDFTKAIELLNKAKDLFTETSDWFNVTECLNHLAYTKKLMSNQILNEGIKLTEDALRIQKKYQTNMLYILRARISLLESKGNFEEALDIANEMLEKTGELRDKADLLIHITQFSLRTGNISNAEKHLEDVEKLMSKCWNSVQEPQRSIWKTKMLIQKGLIFYNKGEFDNALELAHASYDLAKKKSLRTRVRQAEVLLRLVKSKL